VTSGEDFPVLKTPLACFRQAGNTMNVAMYLTESMIITPCAVIRRIKQAERRTLSLGLFEIGRIIKIISGNDLIACIFFCILQSCTMNKALPGPQTG